MPSQPKPRLNLRIVLLTFCAVQCRSHSCQYILGMFKIQKRELIENALEGNRAYAARIAAAVEGVLSSDLDRLEYGSAILSKNFSDRQLLAVEARRLLEQDNSFNSVLIANADGTIVASAPERLQLNGQSLQRREPLERRKPMVSNAFTLSLAIWWFSYPSRSSMQVGSTSGWWAGLSGWSSRIRFKR
jgi:hypothetical protein